jgi:hypothetical protein
MNNQKSMTEKYIPWVMRPELWSISKIKIKNPSKSFIHIRENHISFERNNSRIYIRNDNILVG